MDGQTAVVLGSTGLIGKQLLQLLLIDPSFPRVRILVRRPSEIIHPKLETMIVDFDNTDDLRVKTGKGNCIFCCVGTTMKKVSGDKAAYRKIDHDIPLNTARIGLENGFTKYLLVSSVGASATASNFYLQLKGLVEKEISALPYESIHVFRPSILLGKRNEFRMGEEIGKEAMQLFSFLLAGKWRKYKPIQSSQVARAMVAAAKSNEKGVMVHEYDGLKQLSAVSGEQ